MKTTIEIKLSEEDLNDIRDMFRQEIEPIKKALSHKKISTKEAMEILGIKGYNTLKELMRSGELPSYKDSEGGRPKLLLGDVIEFSTHYKKYRS